ncbi:MAG: DUF2905 domain-containing protein [Chloroflexota bacterium]|nr:DUF2905 domain-containing protein [Chloroflexota bacterium]MDE2941121.1 DUF2905 domain-containing protein [Chloroflexota bacterium]MDE3267353.1 DUF2905 domain-containing protein [Chloroflexota bacterium]
MTGLDSLGRLLVLTGGVLVLLGILLVLAPKLPFLPRLPGDLVLRRGELTIYLPIATMLLVSLGLTILLNAIVRLFRG